MIYGKFSSSSHGAFDTSNLYRARALTGSESSFFNTAIGLAERGHSVLAFCDSPTDVVHSSGAMFVPLQFVEHVAQIRPLDAVLSWNEPDYFRLSRPDVLRVVAQQLNDWPYCRFGWQSFTDIIVLPSESSKANHARQVSGVHMEVVPNSCNLEHFAGDAPTRNPHRVVWSSSPDRGLHHLLTWWPDVRKRVPDAELRIFYRLEPWLRGFLGRGDELGRRAETVAAALDRFAREDAGVRVMGPVDNLQMAREYQAAAVLAYPCDPVSYTEGFGCSVLDAAAGGCMPIISPADALPEVHGPAARVIGLDRAEWVNAVSSALLDGGAVGPRVDLMRAHAITHSRQRVVEKWESLLVSSVAWKSKRSAANPRPPAFPPSSSPR